MDEEKFTLKGFEYGVDMASIELEKNRALAQLEVDKLRRELEGEGLLRKLNEARTARELEGERLIREFNEDRLRRGLEGERLIREFNEDRLRRGLEGERLLREYDEQKKPWISPILKSKDDKGLQTNDLNLDNIINVKKHEITFKDDFIEDGLKFKDPFSKADVELLDSSVIYKFDVSDITDQMVVFAVTEYFRFRYVSGNNGALEREFNDKQARVAAWTYVELVKADSKPMSKYVTSLSGFKSHDPLSGLREELGILQHLYASGKVESSPSERWKEGRIIAAKRALRPYIAEIKELMGIPKKDSLAALPSLRYEPVSFSNKDEKSDFKSDKTIDYYRLLKEDKPSRKLD